MKLYEIGEELRRLLADAVNEQTGEISAELEARLSALEGAFNEKVERIALLALETQTDAEGILMEADRLAHRALAHRRAAERLKNYLAREMEATGIRRVDGKLATVSLVASPPSLRVVSEQDIPAEYWMPRPPKLKRAEAIRALVAGERIPGLELVRGNHIRIS